MATTNIPYQNTLISPTGGQNASLGTGMRYDFSLNMPFSDGEVTIVLTDTLTGIQTQVGFGEITGVVPTFSFTYNNKVYVLSGATTYFSAITAPTVWNDPNGIFNGFVTMSNYYATQSDVLSIAAYQGRLAFFSNYTVQFWIIDPNPDNWQQAQVLTNTGTFAPLSVASLGDLETLYLNYTGVRSLRVRENSLNAFVNDIGSPIDTYIQAVLNANSLTVTQAACSISDPTTGRYWLFVPDATATNGVGKIYVLSYYPSSKIIAWSTYDPSTNGQATFFTPQLFALFKGQVFCRSTNNVLYAHGGSNGNTYDACLATAQVPFFDMKRPGAKKQSQDVDFDVTGTWTVYGSSDWIDGTLTNVASIGQATYDQGWLGFTSEGTHFTLEATTVSASAAKLSGATLYYSIGASPVDD